MPQVVFIPGIFGCFMLRKGDDFELWPPIGQAEPMPVETRVAGLLDPTTRHGGIIPEIEDPFIHPIEYRQVLRAIGRMQGVTLQQFPYDWRCDVTTTVPDALAAFLDGLPAGQRIILVAHSMGGLIARWLLESGKYRDRPWFAHIDQFISIAVPHLGAPLSLFRILGLADFEPVFFDRFACKQLAARPDLYPAAHQLLPTSSMQTVTFTNQTHATVEKAFPGLPQAGYSALDKMHAVLDKFARPKGVTYQLAYGRGLPTTSAISATGPGDPNPQQVMDSGDTTVPMWSGCPSFGFAPAKNCFQEEEAFDQATHVGILQDPRFLNILQVWITGTTVPMV